MTDLDPEETLAKDIQEGKVLATKVGGEKCIKPFVASVEKIVKFPLNQPVVNPFFAANVSKKKVVKMTQEGSKTEAQEGQILEEEINLGHKTTNSLKQLTEN